MKLISSIVLLIMPLMASAEGSKSVAPWYAGESVKDNSLSKSESAFEFHFTITNYNQDDGTPPSPKLVYSCNATSDSLMMPASRILKLKVKPGKYIFQFYIGPTYYEIKTDSIAIKGGYKTPVYINFKSSVELIIEDKPVIYVYSELPQPVNITLSMKGELGFTYPAYNAGWNFIATPDGSIYANGKNFPYLFWEGTTPLDHSTIDWSEGSVVKKEELVNFFESNLPLMGLNQKEVTDYITYWCPRMMENDSCYIHFLIDEDYDEYATMNISPEPDAKFQVFMLWTSANGVNSAELIPQSFSGFERKGLTVVEWGGAQMKYFPSVYSIMMND